MRTRATDEAEEVAEGTEEDELERAHGIGRVGRAVGAARPDAEGGGEDARAPSRSQDRSGWRQVECPTDVREAEQL